MDVKYMPRPSDNRSEITVVYSKVIFDREYHQFYQLANDTGGALLQRLPSLHFCRKDKLAKKKPSSLQPDLVALATNSLLPST
jgi:hypothetical protein